MHKLALSYIMTALYNFLEEHNILHHNQHGFRKNNSTIHALMQITERIKTSIDSGKFGCGIFIDLRKAFHTVNHNILLTKSEHYGIRDSMLKWFQSYLSGRKQFVSFHGVSSELLENKCGVPQGFGSGATTIFYVY